MGLRVAFRLGGPQSWTGGVNYVLNMCRILRAHTPEIEPVIFAPDDIDPWVKEAAESATGTSYLPLRERRHRNDVLALLGAEERGATAAFAAAGIDVIFESMGFYGRGTSLPVVSWLPDFQHRALPALFSRKAWLIRESRFRMILATRRHVLVSSEDAKADLLRYYGAPHGQVTVARFAVRLDQRPTWQDGESVRLAYKLPERFLFLPNQFWVHKNHMLVVEALGRIAPQSRPTIVATGSPHDPRAPDLMDQLKYRVAALGLESNFRILGMLPHAEILSLNARCDALINPSLFEGWSTTVEEAKVLNTPMILSDLPVHREQVGKAAVFFNRHDPSQLAAVLSEPRLRQQNANLGQLDVEAQISFAARVSETFMLAAAESPVGRSPAALFHSTAHLMVGFREGLVGARK